MDVIFDIDGTLANAEHRIHFITNPAYFVAGGITRDMKPDWDSFLAGDLVSQDASIEPIWETLLALTMVGHRIIFITGRRESERQLTKDWLFDQVCPHRARYMEWCRMNQRQPVILMRKSGDRRPSQDVKRDSLRLARRAGYEPVLVFEDRATDTAMWREEGLVCCQVADGHY